MSTLCLGYPLLWHSIIVFLWRSETHVYLSLAWSRINRELFPFIECKNSGYTDGILLLVYRCILLYMSAELIRVNEKTKDRLKSLKEHPRETYCDVIERLIGMAVDDEPLSDETLKGIEEGLADLEAGRVRPLRDIAKEMGI